MRLWLSVGLLLILTCVVLEISAAKSKRDTEATKDNSKSTDPKEVHFSKNKADQNKKGKGKAEEVVREKKRRSAEGSENKDAKEVSKKNKKESDVKLPKEGQKKQKSNKQQKTSRNGESYKKEKTAVKVAVKDTGKKQKRSIEPEQPKKTGIDDETDSSAEPEDSESISAPKKGGKGKSEKKTGIRKDGEKQANAEEVVVSLSDIKTGSLEKDKNIKEEEKGGAIKTKNQKDAKKSEVNVKRKKGESKRDKIQTSDQEGEELENIKYLEDLSEKSYYLNGDGLIKEKKAGDNKNVKKHKSLKKSSKTDPACENEVNAKVRVPDQRVEAYESGSCNLEADCLPENTENAERSKYFAYDSSQSSSTDIKLDGVDNEAQKSDVYQELTDES